MWNDLLSLGDAYAQNALLGAKGVRAAWAMLMPEDAVLWFAGQVWTDAALARLGQQWGEVWWRYLLALCGMQHPGPNAPRNVVWVAEAGLAQLFANAQARSTFVAVLLQLAITERHDQALCCIRANPARPPFYDKYVDRGHTGSLFSLQSLLRCEAQYTCAKRAVDRFRSVRGRVVAEILDDAGVEFIRRPRSKIKRFMCAKCASRPRPGCRRCTRLQSHHPHALLAYWGQNRTWVSVSDAHTVCGDATFVPARAVTPRARVVQAGATWVVDKKARARVSVPPADTHTTAPQSTHANKKQHKQDASPMVLHLSREVADGGNGAAARKEYTTLHCASNSMLPVLSAPSDCFSMLRDEPRVVHGMRTSVNVDTVWQRRPRRPASPHRTVPLQVDAACADRAVWSYAVWRSLIAVCASATNVQQHLPLCILTRTHIVCNVPAPVVANV